MIFYFSGTGNTRWAAKTISQHTCDALIDISKTENLSQNYTLAENERIGFCFPVHGWRPPMIVRNFIKQMNITNAAGHYCYALCTAGDNIGETVNILKDDLQKREIHLDSAFSLIMPESYVGLPFMDVDTIDNEMKKKQKAAVDLSEYIKYIANRQTGIEKLTIGRWPKINSRVIGGFFTKHLITDKPFHVVDKRCISCGLCATSCPIGNISLNSANQPEWHHDGTCLACFSCYHHCPNHAIEYGYRTKNKGQYYFK